MKYDESYSKVIRKHKYKDKDKDKDKDTGKVPEKPNICYFLILMTYSFQMKYDDRYLTLVILFTPVTLVTLFWSYNQFYRAECIFSIFGTTSFILYSRNFTAEQVFFLYRVEPVPYLDL